MKNTKKAIQHGFSLVEMLVVIAVIGIIAAIAVPNIGRINDAAKDAKNRRNAQNIASVYASANAAGHDFFNTDLATTVTDIVTGYTIDPADEGPFAGTFFGVPNLSAIEQTAALQYLEIGASGMLIYNGDA